VFIYRSSFPLLTMALLKGLGQHEGHQGRHQFDAGHAGHAVPGITQSIPTAPGPPPLEQYAPGIPVRGVSPPTPFLVHIALLTAPVTVGGANQLVYWSHTSSQCSKVFSRKSEPGTFRNVGHRTPQKRSRESLPPQPWLACQRPSHQTEPIGCY